MQALLALKASAGSGKTFQLTLRYLSLLFHGANPSEILALTFTKKAAREMKERISGALQVLQDAPDSDKALLLISELDKSGISEAKIRDDISHIYRRFLHSDLKIMTIDSFLALILKKFCWYVGVHHNFSIVSDRESIIQKRFLQQLSHQEMESLLMFASIEEKKLKSIFDLFALFLEKETELPSFPEYLHDAALEVQILQEASLIQTHIHNHPDASASAKKFVTFDSVEGLLERGKTWLTYESLEEYRYFKKVYDPSLDMALAKTKGLLKRWFDQRETRLMSNLFHLFSCYKETRKSYKESRNELTFDDVTHKAYTLFEDTLNHAFLYFRLDSTIRHILIDEFQDTSTLQYAILQPLIDEIRAGIGQQGDLRSFFYVGDVKQSIYRFRGSRSALFDHVGQGMDIRNLNINYRSCESIVTFVNHVFKGKIPGYFDQEPKLPENTGGYVKVTSTEDTLEEMREYIGLLLQKGVCPEEIAILTFKNDDILAVESTLSLSFPDIQIATETSSKLIQQPSVQALLNLLRHLHTKEPLYLSNAMTLLGEEPLKIPDFSGFSIREKPSALAYRLMEKFQLRDDYCIQFLEHLFSYGSMDECMQEVGYLEESVDSKSIQGIKVMTIHKSKGLEFPHVLILDRLGGKHHGKEPFVFEYHGVQLSKIWLRTKMRASCDRDYASALEQEEALERDDLLNMLYVAFTRAKESLHILQKAEKSDLEILDLAHEEYGVLEITPKSIELQEEISPLNLHMRDFGRQRDILEQEKEYTPDNLHAIHYGLASHLYMELVDFTPSLFGRNPLDALINRYGIQLTHPELARIQIHCEKAIAMPAFQALLRQSDIYRELPFTYQEKQGQIDLLLLKKKKAIIVDYKTSHEIKEAYIDQLCFYRDAIREISGRDSECYILLLGEEPRLEKISLPS